MKIESILGAFKRKSGVAAILLWLAFSTAGFAATIGPSCATCQGSLYTLTYSLDSSGGGFETYLINLEIDTNGYTGGGLTIGEVAIKVSPSFQSSSLVDAPGGVGNWTVVSGGINANGCSGAGSGFVCADYTGAGHGVAVGGVLNWTFQHVIQAGSLFTGANEASIKARYLDAQGNKIGALVSEGITLTPGDNPEIPEPASMMLLGGGLLALGVAKRKARQG